MVVFALAHWLNDLGPVVNVILAVVAALFAIVVDRRVLRRDNL
ncbi:MAG: hypothetical protein Q8S00_07840 [Deltaproteobacteria bacterium]|nr:hypothetical protein [Deltaproteobacteria bacterium]MDZ4344771.1 hypothetical protein [Candidatus Binatia bacterium]